ncbi:hypothetical protein [Kordia sp.]|uniref:hypothetical protein n=1 Tax=Kordia sp. TaxID=1965332 RepID=UPI003B59E136
MLKSILNLKGVRVVEKSELKLISGGVRYRITCIFPDGNNWSGASESSWVATRMDQHCSSQGGTTALSYEAS